MWGIDKFTLEHQAFLRESDMKCNFTTKSHFEFSSEVLFRILSLKNNWCLNRQETKTSASGAKRRKNWTESELGLALLSKSPKCLAQKIGVSRRIVTTAAE
jgi:hypothetical protein